MNTNLIKLSLAILLVTFSLFKASAQTVIPINSSTTVVGHQSNLTANTIYLLGPNVTYTGTGGSSSTDGGFLSGGGYSITFTGSDHSMLQLVNNKTTGATSRGGAIYCVGDFNINGSYDSLLLSSNTSSAGSGVVYANSSINIGGTYGNVLFNANAANGSGGALYSQTGSIAINTLTTGSMVFRDNYTTKLGGGVLYSYDSNNGYVSIGGTYGALVIVSNTAASAAGAIFAAKDISITGSYGELRVSDNTAITGGGGAFDSSGGNININGSYGDILIESNKAGSNGGAFYSGSNITISGSYGNLVIDSNVSQQDGGAFYASGSIAINAAVGGTLAAGLYRMSCKATTARWFIMPTITTTRVSST